MSDDPKTTSIHDKRQLAVDAELAAYPYRRSFSRILDAAHGQSIGYWQIAQDIAEAAGEASGLSVDKKQGFIFDRDSGLTAYVLVNRIQQQVRLIFGGTSSGETTGGLNIRSLFNSTFTFKQWVANAQNTLRFERPVSYLQAKELTEEVIFFLDFLNDYRDYQLILSGHSKGGGEATYSALCQQTPVQAICFASAELGDKLLGDIPTEHRVAASHFITHYLIEGDLVPKVGTLLPGLELLGLIYTLPSQHPWDSPLDRHDQFVRHIRHFCSE